MNHESWTIFDKPKLVYKYFVASSTLEILVMFLQWDSIFIVRSSEYWSNLLLKMKKSLRISSKYVQIKYSDLFSSVVALQAELSMN